MVVNYVLCVVTAVRGEQNVNPCRCAVENPGFPGAERVVWQLPRCVPWVCFHRLQPIRLKTKAGVEGLEGESPDLDVIAGFPSGEDEDRPPSFVFL